MYDTNAGARRDWRDEGVRPRKVTVMSAEEAAAQAEENKYIASKAVKLRYDEDDEE